MKRLLLPLILLLCAGAALAQQGFNPWVQQSGEPVSGQVILCATGQGRQVAPCGSTAAPMNVLAAPFSRLHRDPIKLRSLGPTPKVFAINRPANAMTYRIVNPCDVDIRLLGVMAESDKVTEDTGVLYLARTEATMGTSKPNFISAMTIGTPTGDCTPEMHYGMGGG